MIVYNSQKQLQFSVTLGLVRSATASEVNLIVLRPPRKTIGTATVVVVLVLVADSQPKICIYTEMEKRADTADISVLFFGGCANFLAVYAQTK